MNKGVMVKMHPSEQDVLLEYILMYTGKIPLLQA